MDWYTTANNKEYPLAGNVVSGLSVLSEVPNTESIGASLTEYTVLPNIREVPMSDFNIAGQSYDARENVYIKELAEEIDESRQIKPLIVVIDREGPYILEGSHRIDALYNLGVETFPALVVIDEGAA